MHRVPSMRKITILICWLFVAASSLPAQTPIRVQTGVYLLNLYDLNMDGHSFYADFYLWFKWKGANFDPTSIELVNAVEKWGMTQTVYNNEQIDTLKDGTCYKMVRIEGRFFHSYGLENFPLDEHALDIQIENPEYGTDSLVFVRDTGAYASIRPTLQIDGWKLHSPEVTEAEHRYGTNFGNPEENAHTYSKITYTIKMKRPFSYFLLKMMLPLFVVILVSIGALLLHPQYIDARSQLPIGGLLTAVLLQEAYTSTLPDTGYMVLMDKIYLLAYAVIAGVLLLVIMAGNALVKGDDQLVHKIDWREAWQSAALFVLFAIGVLLLCV
jgi:hypothetical protein